MGSLRTPPHLIKLGVPALLARPVAVLALIAILWGCSSDPPDSAPPASLGGSAGEPGIAPGPGGAPPDSAFGGQGGQGGMTSTGGASGSKPEARGPVQAFDDAYDAVGNTSFKLGTAEATATVFLSGSLLDNDTLAPGSQSPLTVVATSQPTKTLLGGEVTLSQDGSFYYVPPPGVSGVADAFSYVAKDALGNEDRATVFVRLNGLLIYVDSSKQDGNGTDVAPLTSLTDVPATPRSTIFVRAGSGPTSGDLTLAQGQRLIGEPMGLSLTLGGKDFLYAASGGPRPTLTGSITVLKDCEIRALDIESASGKVGLLGQDVGGLRIADVSVKTVGATAVDLNTGLGVNLSFNSLSANGGAIGVRLRELTGPISVLGNGLGQNDGSGGLIENQTGTGLFLLGVNGLTLSSLEVRNSGTDNLYGENLTGFTLQSSRFTTTAAGATNDNVELYNLNGPTTLSGIEASSAGAVGLRLHWLANGGDTPVVVNASAINVSGAKTAGIHAQAEDMYADVALNLSSSTVSGIPGSGIVIRSSGSYFTAHISQSTIRNVGIGLDVGGGPQGWAGASGALRVLADEQFSVYNAITHGVRVQSPNWVLDQIELTLRGATLGGWNPGEELLGDGIFIESETVNTLSVLVESSNFAISGDGSAAYVTPAPSGSFAPRTNLIFENNNFSGGSLLLAGGFYDTCARITGNSIWSSFPFAEDIFIGAYNSSLVVEGTEATVEAELLATNTVNWISVPALTPVAPGSCQRPSL